MIISASFRTDIPAFYGEWFLRRLEAGHCLVKNPYDGKPFSVSLRREHVDGFFFWTKNLGPFAKKLEILKTRGYPFIVSYSITGYPRELERSVVSAEKAIDHLRRVAGDFGSRRAVWRYDPILITSLTDFDFHRRNFDRLARDLAGSTDEVVVSFAEMYRKTKRHLFTAAEKFHFSWEDPSDDQKREFLIELAQIAQARGLKFSLCAQRQYLSREINDAVCIDVQRLSDVAGLSIHGTKPGHRGKRCGCYQSRDIGVYNSCLHGCAYCYAVESREQAREFYQRHDATAESLASGDCLNEPLFPCNRQLSFSM